MDVYHLSGKQLCKFYLGLSTRVQLIRKVKIQSVLFCQSLGVEMGTVVVTFSGVQDCHQTSQKCDLKAVEAGMEKGIFLLIHKLSFLLSPCFLVYLRLLTSPVSSVSAFLLQPDSDNILQGLPNIVHSQIQSPVFCKYNSHFNYESVESLGMPSFLYSLETIRPPHRYAVLGEQLCPALFDLPMVHTSSWQAVTVTLG